MKKFLSLVLALVMTMSLVTVSAGAKDFTDSDKIQYAEAVDVMSAVKVIDGYAEGDFRPSTTLTRGAAAKIICNLILGPTAASALVADAAPYKDVPTNHTFAGYIAYCQKEGIISGYADGTFRPANSLTGYAFMKMLLGALGYDGAVEGYTGPNWSINVAKRALNIGLADDLVGSFNGIKAVTREEACLYALNTMTANMVEYDSKTSVTAGTTTVVVTGSKAKEMEAVNSKTDGNVFDADKIVQFAEKYFTDLKVRKDADDFGRPANAWRLKSNDIGTYTNTPDATFTKKVSKADLYNTVGKSVYDDLKDGKAKLTAYFDGDPESVKSTDIDSKWVNKTDTGKVNSTGNGDLTEVYVDDDNNVTLVTVRTYVFQAATDYDAKKESVNLAQDGNKFDNRTKAGTVITLQDRAVEAEDYEVTANMSAKELVNALSAANSYTYTYAGKTTDSDNEILKELYVTVTAATLPNTPGGGDYQEYAFDAGDVAVSDVRRVGQNVLFNLTVTPGDHVAQGNINLSNFEVSYKGVKVATAPAIINVPYSGDGKTFVHSATLSLSGLSGLAGSVSDDDVKVSIKNATFVPEYVKVEYYNADDAANIVRIDASELCKSGDPTKAAPTSMKIAGSSTLAFGYKTTDAAATLNAKAYEADGKTQINVATGDDSTTAANKATTVTLLAAGASGKDVIKVYITGIKNMVENYTLTNLDKTKDLETLYGWKDAAKGSKLTLTLSRSAGPIPSNNNNVKITGASLDTAVGNSVNYGLKITLTTGTVVVFKNDTTTAGTIVSGDTFKVTKDTTIGIQSIEKLDAPKLTSLTGIAVEDVDVNGTINVGDTFKLTFDKALNSSSLPTLTASGDGNEEFGNCTVTLDATDKTNKTVICTLVAAGSGSKTTDTTLTLGNIVGADGMKVQTGTAQKIVITAASAASVKLVVS